MMTMTEYAAIAALIAVAAVTLWMLHNHRATTPTRTARHRGAPTLRLPRPTHPERAASRR